MRPGALQAVTDSAAGQSGTGRTTFVNTLCESLVLEHKAAASPELAHQEDGIKIQPHSVGPYFLRGRPR